MVTTITWVLAFALGGYVLYTLARGGWRLDWVSNILSYIIIILILIPFIPRHITPLDGLPQEMLVTTSALGFWAAILKIVYYILYETVFWLKALASALIGITNMLYILLAIYTIARIGWEYWLVAVLIGAVIAIWDGKMGFVIAYPFIALAIIAGLLSPFMALISNFLGITIPSPGATVITIINSSPNNTLVITDQGFGYTPTILITQLPPSRVEGAVWLWLKFNYTVSTTQIPGVGLLEFMSVSLRPSLQGVTCPGGVCGAYYILYGTPISVKPLGNGTVVITTDQPIGVWLWGGGYWVNKSLVTLSARVGNKTLTAKLTGCNYTAGPSHWLEPTSLTYYNNLLSMIPDTKLPNNYPVGYEELTINVTPGVARLGNETVPITCVIKLYGVVNNTWAPNTPIGYTSVIASLISVYSTAPNLGNAVTKVLVTIFILIGIGIGGIIAWDWWYRWLKMVVE